MLTRATFVGPWAGLPVAWTEDNCFDEATYRGDVQSCCQASVPGVYTGGTSGEFYAMEFDEFREVARATIEVCRQNDTPVMIGCSSTSTSGATRRAEFAAELGADAVQVALPFWMQVADDQIVPFFREVAASAGDLAFSIYETTRAKRTLTVDEHRAVRDAVPRYLMVKANEGTLGATANGCAALSEFVNVFVHEGLWGELGPVGAMGCCSAMIYWNPRLTLKLWEMLERRDWSALQPYQEKLDALHSFLGDHYGQRGFTDTAYDRMGGRAGGFLQTSLKNRGPYVSPTEEDVETLRAWYREHFPEMLKL